MKTAFSFPRLITKISLLAVLFFSVTSRGHGQEQWNNTSTTWSVNEPNPGTAYTIGSGVAANANQEIWFRGFNTGGTSILDKTYNVSWLWFNQSPLSGSKGYTISTSNNSALVLSGAGIGASGNAGIEMTYFMTGTNANEAFNVPIYLGGGQVTFSNNSIYTQGDTMSFGLTTARQNISGLQVSSGDNPATLLLFGVGNGVINDNIIDGTNQGSLTNSAVVSLNIMSEATWTLTGTNTYSGTTAMKGGGTLVLDDTGANNGQKISTNSLTLGGVFPTGGGTSQNYGGGATVKLLGNESAASTQTISELDLNMGASTISVTSGNNQNATFNLNNISRGAGAMVNFQTVNTGSSGVATITTTNFATNDILGGWATLNGTDWATVDDSGNIVAATYTDDSFDFGNNTNITGSETADGNTTNSLRFATAASTTLTLAAGNTTVQSGGILMSSSVGAHDVTIAGSGFLLTQTGEYFIDQEDTAGKLFITTNLGHPTLTLAGGGTLNLSGTNTNVTTINVDAGTLQMGSSGALGAGATSVNMVGQNSALDLNGFNTTLAALNSYNIIEGAVAQGAGLVPVVENTKAGSISTLTISGASSSVFDGDLTEGAGAVLNIKAANSVINGGWNNLNFFASWALGTDGNLPLGTYDLINGGLTVTGGQVNMGFDLYMLGALNLGGNLGPFNGNQGGFGLVSTTYLSGNGSYLGINRDGLFVNLGGSSVTDTWGGQYSGNLVVNGAGTLNLSALQTSSSVSGIEAAGTAAVILPGISAGTGNGDGSFVYNTIAVMGDSTIKLTGTSGVIASVSNIGGRGYGIGLAGGTLWIAPSTVSSSSNIVVTGLTGAPTANASTGVITDPTFFYGEGDNITENASVLGNGTLLLDRGGNASLRFTIGNASDATKEIVRNSVGTLTIGATDGLAGLGSTEKFTILGTSTALPTITNGMVNSSIVGESFASGSMGMGTFLTYSGTGASTDAGFQAVTFDDTNFSATTTNATKEFVSSATSISSSNAVYALRVDSTLTNSTGGTLTIGAGSGQAGLILNSGTIAGAGTVTAGAAELTLYTSGSSYIYNTLTGTGGLTLFGPGTVYLAQSGPINYTGTTTLNSGALDVGAASNFTSTGVLLLEGGVFEASGTFSRTLGSSTSQVEIFNGGFAASSAAGLVVKLNNNTTTPIAWVSGTFMSDAGVLQLGSATALGVVNLQNNIALGSTTSGYDTAPGTIGTWNSATLYRNIGVTDNTGTFADYGQISGILSSGGDYRGIEKSGNGMLYLSGVNTYIGPTAIAGGTLAINSDASLGLDPTAAYAVTGTVTMGALQINGGTTLLDNTATNITLSANRTVLLGGGGASGVAALTGSTFTIASRIGDSVNGAGSLDIDPTVGLGYDASTTHGAVVLTSNYNTYSGGTTVENGATLYANNTLATVNVVNGVASATPVNTSATGSGNVLVMSGGKLRGTGYIAPAAGKSIEISSGASLAPGTTSATTVPTGFLTVTAAGSGAALKFDAPASLATMPQLSFDLGTGLNGVTGAGQVVNGLTLAGASTYIALGADFSGEVQFSLNAVLPTIVAINDLTGGDLAAGNYLLFAGTANSDYSNITTDALTGQILTGLALDPGFAFTGDDLALNAKAGLYLENGDIYLNVAVPEPSTWAMLFLGLGALVWLARRKLA